MRLTHCLSCVIALVLLGACTPKSESEQLAELRESFTYRHYHQLSETGLPLSLSAYQKTQALTGRRDLPQISQADLCTVRVMLAYGALTTNKTTIALVETDLVEQASCRPLERGAATSLRAILFARQDWPTLAATENQRAQQQLLSISPNHSIEDLLIMHAALGAASLQDKQFDAALVHLDAISLILQQPWLSRVEHAVLHLEQGDLNAGMRDIKRLSEDNSVPPPVRAELAEFIRLVEAKTGNVDSSGFMYRALAVALWHALQSSGSGNMASMTKFVDQHSSHLQEELVSTKQRLLSWIGID